MAVELKLSRYDAKRHLARFDVRALGSLGGGLRHLNGGLDQSLPRSFQAPSLFIDNSSYQVGCTLGEAQLMAIDYQSPELSGLTPANGDTLPAEQNQPLYSIYENRFGGTPEHTFVIPKMSAPPGTSWYVCINGFYPNPEHLTPACTPGEITYWSLPFQPYGTEWVPADGRTLPTWEFQEYAAAYADSAPTFTLPNVTAPPGMTALICMESREAFEPYLGEINLFPAMPGSQQVWWEPAAGQAVSPSRNHPLTQLLEMNQESGGNIPNVPAVGPGASPFIAASGAWPFR
jgi:hypothetical protein